MDCSRSKYGDLLLNYKPPLKDIIKRYYKKFGNNDESSEEQQHDDLVTAVTPSAEPSD